MIKLDEIHSPSDIKKLHKQDLAALCEQLRQTIIDTVSANGGHLASNLGVVELTVALHRVFTTPQDAIVWDVGHQCYAHKLLTDRYAAFSTLRKKDGVSGFPKPVESEHDAFITGHSSTSISAANGIAKAKALTGDKGYAIAVIGDGALTGGLAYEGLSNAGRSHDRLIIILNDNKMSISQNVGFVARYLGSLRSKVRYVRWKQRITNVLCRIPLIGKRLNRQVQNVKKSVKRSIFSGTSFFENMGFHYMGPVDGHDLGDLTQALLAAKSIDRPVVLHVATVKGKGYAFAEKTPDTYHGISCFDSREGAVAASAPTFSSHFGDSLCTLAAEDDRLVAITAAMKSGTCLERFAAAYPKRFFDTGIAEGHAVTFASGMGAAGLLPVFAVYSSFLQRSFDQLLNDTAIMNNHIVLAIDRAGVVPDDGETHQGIFDVAMLRAIPHTTIYAPSCFAELTRHLRQALYDCGGIAAVRYPKGGEHPALTAYEPSYQPYTLLAGKNKKLLLVTYGRTFGEVLTARGRLEQNGQYPALLKLNRIHPLEDDVIERMAGYDCVLFFEEVSRAGGVGEYIGGRLAQCGYGGHYAVRAIDTILGACTVDEGLRSVGLDTAGILQFVREQTDKQKAVSEAGISNE